MCTRPNYMVYYRTASLKDKPSTWKFFGHYNYDELIKEKQDFVEVPCGQCLECRIQYTRSWANRCEIESRKSKDNYFITLTYDDEHLPPHGSLDPNDTDRFIHSIRDYFRHRGFKGKIRYFYCGEYGDQTFRPHYHLVLFNCPLDDLTYEFKQMEDGRLKKHLRPNNNGDLMYSELIHKCWDYKGEISVGRFSYDTAAYVAQYCTKKINPKLKDKYAEMNVHPEFLRMSKGIGENGFKKELYELDNICIAGKISALPRYYDKLFKKIDVNEFVNVQRTRNMAKYVRYDTYINSDQHKERVDEMREYRLKKLSKTREQI